mmetsp:Transcript_20036/g.29481  ORF Transcript_20036/g.29481 Transcript_20036/m.29481 type:complete len:120 (-) Transcript_20036:344-703(-)
MFSSKKIYSAVIFMSVMLMNSHFSSATNDTFEETVKNLRVGAGTEDELKGGTCGQVCSDSNPCADTWWNPCKMCLSYGGETHCTSSACGTDCTVDSDCAGLLCKYCNGGTCNAVKAEEQ